MKIYVVASGGRVPDWVNIAYENYAKRFPRECRLELIEVAGKKRTKTSDLARVRELEASALSRAVPKHCERVALDRGGRQFSTLELAGQLRSWLGQGSDVAFVIGGPDGLPRSLLETMNRIWSLSELTFPHSLVRIIVAEQLYRAWTIVNGHPYHRGE